MARFNSRAHVPCVSSKGRLDAEHNHSRELYRLMVDLFSSEHLRRFLGFHYDQDVVSALPAGSPTHAMLTKAALDILSRHGAIDRAFFVALAEEFPGRAKDIARVEGYFTLCSNASSSSTAMGSPLPTVAAVPGRSLGRLAGVQGTIIAPLLLAIPLAVWGLSLVSDDVSAPDTPPGMVGPAELTNWHGVDGSDTGAPTDIVDREEGSGETGGMSAERTCPEGMVYVQGTGEHVFVARRKRRELDGFCIAITETTVEEYRDCVEAGHCTPADWHSPGPDGVNWNRYCNARHPSRGQHPINCVSWYQSTQYCEWVGGRLPTEWEWEWAARGREEARPFPWGDRKPTCKDAIFLSRNKWGCGKDRTWRVGSRSPTDTRSRDGLLDLLGNVREWTSSEMGPKRVTRGGSWVTGRKYLTVHSEYTSVDERSDHAPEIRGVSIGFRCASSMGGS